VAEHPNVARIRDGYAAFAKGDMAILNDLFAEDLQWHEAGRNQVSGEYHGRDAAFGLLGKVVEITEGTLRIDLHAVFADDEHGVALVTVSGSRDGRSINVNAVHVMHLRDGKVAEFWNANTDQYAVDELIG
jgi:ketosteroid isomerase-like protein